jgi:hypothetical protein
MVPRGSLRGRRGSGVPAEREEGGRGKIDIAALLSHTKPKIIILIGAVSASKFDNKQSVFQQIRFF